MEKGRLTDTGGADALSDLLAEGLAEGDLTLLEDAVEELQWRSQQLRVRWKNVVRVDVRSSRARESTSLTL